MLAFGGHTLDGALLPPEVPRDDAHARAVVVGDLGNVSAFDVLIARRGHLQR